MAQIPEYFNVGDKENITLERLLVTIEEIYTLLAVAVNQKPDIYETANDGDTSDVSLNNGDININTTTGKVEMLTSHDTVSTVTWTTLS